jgi:hypothetical protein
MVAAMTTRTLVVALTLAITQAGARADTPQKPATASKVDVAKHVVRQYAFEAYPTWAMQHTDKDCPAKLAELTEYMQGTTDGKDPWGQAYKLMCGKTLPAGAKGVAVSSAGPDGKPGTADDINSWE